MCIIVYKPKFKNTPSKDTLKECFNNNNDGAGYMFNYKNRVVSKKGFMNFNEFYNSYINDYNRYNLKTKDVVIHFRIGTSGGITKERTHSFDLLNPLKSDLSFISKYAVMHNGVFSDYSYSNIYSDTQLFIKDFLNPLIKRFNYKLDNELLSKVINASISYSKLALLDGKDCYIYGDFIEDNGLFYSNTTYKPYEYKYNYKTYRYYE